jgi:hypothetical protein
VSREWSVAARYTWAEEGPGMVSQSRGEAGRWVPGGGMVSTAGTFRVSKEREHEPKWQEITNILFMNTCEGDGLPEQLDFAADPGAPELECRVLWSVFEPCQVAILHSLACRERQDQSEARGWPWMSEGVA